MPRSTATGFSLRSLITYRYIFPRLTMGLALLVFVLTAIGESQREERYARAASDLTYRCVATEATLDPNADI